MFKVEQFFSIDFTPNELKVKLAAIQFDGHAATWHQSILQLEYGSNMLNYWKTYKILLKERFEDILDYPIEEVK